MSDPFDPCPADGFRDLVPWADPYIAALMEKLRRTAEWERRDARIRDELPPPLGGAQTERDGRRRRDWTPRNWPDE